MMNNGFVKTVFEIKNFSLCYTNNCNVIVIFDLWLSYKNFLCD